MVSSINIFYRIPGLSSAGSVRIATFPETDQVATTELYRFIQNKEKFPYDSFKLIHGTCSTKNNCQHILKNNETVTLSFGLLGGKGGFGSRLRAIGAQIEKTTNRDACRDLSGRRLRDIKREKDLKKMLMTQRHLRQEKLRKKREKIEKLRSYIEKVESAGTSVGLLSDIQPRRVMIEEALDQGIKKATEESAAAEATTIKINDGATTSKIVDNMKPKIKLPPPDLNPVSCIEREKKKPQMKTSIKQLTSSKQLWLGIDYSDVDDDDDM